MRDNKSKNQILTVGLLVSALSFALLLTGIWFVLGNRPGWKTIAAFIVLSLIFGGAAAGLFVIKHKIGFILYISGLCVGFFEMLRIFATGMSGWEDLVGMLSLFSWAVIGLGAGGAGLLYRYLYTKMKEHKNHPKE